METQTLLTTASLLSVLFVTLHLADDIVRGMERGGLPNLLAVPILVTWLYGTLMLGERRSGYIITLLGTLLGTLMPVVHSEWRGVAGRGIATSSGLFWVWTLIALGVSSAFAFVLATRGLWSDFRSRTCRAEV